MSTITLGPNLTYDIIIKDDLFVLKTEGEHRFDNWAYRAGFRLTPSTNEWVIAYLDANPSFPEADFRAQMPKDIARWWKVWRLKNPLLIGKLRKEDKKDRKKEVIANLQNQIQTLRNVLKEMEKQLKEIA